MGPNDRLDRIDRRILGELQRDGRITNHALAERVGLSPSACLARVNALRRSGVVVGCHARLDPFRLGIGIVLFAEVTLEGRDADEQSRFESAALAMPEVVEVSNVSGDVDYILKVAAADMSQWNRIKQGLLDGGLGVRRITSHVLMRKPKVFTGYPVADR